MVVRGLKDGMRSEQYRVNNAIVEDFSGNTFAIGRSISSAEITHLIQSGTYTSAGAASVYNTFAAAFSATPVVMVSSAQSAGIFGAPFIPTANLSAGSFAVSGGAAHTGNYLAFGMA